MRYQPIFDIAELCVRKNIRQVVLCPGSRCAPLTLAFTRHPGVTTRTFSDERSAGFVALGIAQATAAPVVIICTSGTAAYNLAPAIAEAYFSQTPLVVFTADRPAEWVAQHDGQTIYQLDIFGKHVKKSFQLPQDYEHADSLWGINRMVNEAVNLSLQAPRGPVHVNASFREPLYPTGNERQFNYSTQVRIITEQEPSLALGEDVRDQLKASWSGFHNILLVAGQHSRDDGIIRTVSELQQKHHVVVVHDVISNLHEVTNSVQHSDLFLGHAPESLKEQLRPDLLITFGQSLISKNLKLFLRKFPARRHWHIQEPGPVADTFKNLTDVFYITPRMFFQFLASLDTFPKQEQEAYRKRWDAEEQRMLRAMGEFFAEEKLSELHLVKSLMENLPEGSNVHLANSMSVRYANFVGVKPDKKGITVFSNRGTSGIDGCVSTAVGHALTSGRMNFLITGDLAFFYDRNSFWHNYSLENLHILLLNNHGGLIFDVLDGPSSIPEAREYFITRQALNAHKLCEEFGFEHLRPGDVRSVKEMMRGFLEFGNRAKVMELESDTPVNKQVLDQLKLKIKTSYEF
jgi:2-succinyl-5-enolpyruvyl-6-hydroxy-3-cyclohexene-1-carboxylate synthase